MYMSWWLVEADCFFIERARNNSWVMSSLVKIPLLELYTAQQNHINKNTTLNICMVIVRLLHVSYIAMQSRGMVGACDRAVDIWLEVAGSSPDCAYPTKPSMNIAANGSYIKLPKWHTHCQGVLHNNDSRWRKRMTPIVLLTFMIGNTEMECSIAGRFRMLLLLLWLLLLILLMLVIG